MQPGPEERGVIGCCGSPTGERRMVGERTHSTSLSLSLHSVCLGLSLSLTLSPSLLDESFRWYRGSRSSPHKPEALYACVCVCRGGGGRQCQGLLRPRVHACICAKAASCDWCTGGGLSGAGRACNVIHATARESKKKREREWSGVREAGQFWTACHMSARTDLHMHSHIPLGGEGERKKKQQKVNVKEGELPGECEHVKECVPMTLIYLLKNTTEYSSK